MTRLGHLLKGLGALVLLAALVGGVPWALWHFVGWPLPHHVPSASQIGRALNHQGIPDQTLIDALAVVVWITWAVLVASIAVEIPAALSGRHAPRLPVAGIFQPVTGRLVAAVVVACLSLAPRPSHTTAALGSWSMSAMAPRPAAALVARDTTLTAATRPAPVAASPVTSAGPAVANGASPAGAASDDPTDATTSTYVVQRGDTLWGIAERQLGDPLRWSEIYQLNEGRQQPGAALTDPHWIDPGWTLLLPVPPATTPPAPAAPTPSQPARTPTPSPASTSPTSPPTNATAPTAPTHTTPQTPAPTSPAATSPASLASPSSPSASGPVVAHRSGEPVRLPSGSVVASSFAAGVAATIAIGRLRRRHAYRYQPPKPGRTLATEPHRPTIHHLRQAATATAPPGGTGPVPAMPVGEEERIAKPGRLDVALRGDETVTVDLTDLSGIALDGPGVDDVTRALVAGLLVRAEPGAVEVLLTDDLAGRLLPGGAANRAIRRVATTDQAARAVESERVSRSRRFEAAGAAAAAQFRAENPENPLPLLLVLLDSLPAESLGRWSALAADAPRLAICILSLAPSPIATGQISIDAARRVLDSTPADRVGVLLGAQLFGLRADEATEVLAAVTEAAGESDLDEDPFAPNATAIPSPSDGSSSTGDISADCSFTGDLSSDDSGEPWPEPSPSPSPQPNGNGDGPPVRPISVRMFGHFEVAVHGELVVTGLRSRARDVLAWSLLRPEGATSDEAVDALWPDTAPDRVHGQFWRSFSDLRARLREAGSSDLEVLTKAGEHYRPCADEIACDLWEFQAGLGEAARTDDPDVARAALRRAVDTYRGDLLAGMDRPWIEAVRADLHRRSLDAHLRLAELEAHTGRPDAAVEVLEHAIKSDRYAEEPYRRLMALHAAHGHPGAVSDVWRLLQARLAELDLDVETATSNLYRQLTANPERRPDPDRVRLPR